MNAPEQGSSAAVIYTALVSIGCVCALLIVTTYLLTRPVIAHKRNAAMQRAVFTVLPGARSSIPLHRGAAGELQVAASIATAELFLGVDADGQMAGVAIAGSAMGYQDLIRLLYGYSPARGEVVGMQVLESRETPGLGDRILHDAQFLSAFSALPIPLDPERERVLHPVAVAAAGRPRQPWQIDAISGATISSRAVARIVADSTAQWVPLVHAQLDTLQRMAADE